MTDAPTESMTELALFELLSLECRIDAKGAVHYYNEQGQIHRVHGPAVKYADGTHAWFQNGQLHRVDGPAIEYADGGRAWYQNGVLHRIDGPAAEWPDGYRAWYINGIELTEAEWQHAVDSMGVV